MNVATASVLNITELLTRVDDDRELVLELFSIFKSVFPSHLQRLSDAIANELVRQVEVESHTFKGMLFNLTASQAAAVVADLENMGRESKVTGMKESLAEFRTEAQTLLLPMESVESQR